MLGKTYENENCSAARALELIGERWSLLIVRNALYSGCTRFSEFQRRLGIAPNILATRLEGFVKAGLMEPGPDREYVLTEKGRDLQPVVVALTRWGDRWAAPDGPPYHYEHDCGGDVRQTLTCAACGAIADAAQVRALPGPGRS
ncbi:winged helix-turn-helix transcriptional regulator [Actinomadura roseirufa]|uniref:winged helix-turn-helix transcriptional regulator n=1 Tax=Actinomadura roseirufa TaxID=2094049 RepID=UPI001041776A|nr:helix-turn-helix domain-containing protein [Actinomadura roseirufa]